MHVCETVEVAGLLCLGADRLLEDCPQISMQAITEYWSASRCRFDAWGRELRSLEQVSRRDLTPLIQPIAEEVFVGQVLTRTMAALATAHDRRYDCKKAGPIARNVVAAHAEGVARVRMLMRSRGQNTLDELHPVGNSVRRWTDLLLGYVAPLCSGPSVCSPAGHAIEFAFDPVRVQEFAYDSRLHTAPQVNTTPLLLASIRAAFGKDESNVPNPQLNRRIAGAALGLFGPEAFDSFGLLRSTLHARVERVSQDTLGLVEQLFQEPSKPKPSTPLPAPPPIISLPIRWRPIESDQTGDPSAES